MLKPRLIIMVGNIVSGKTTWIRKYLAIDQIAIEKDNWAVISKDALRRMIGSGTYVYDEKLEPIIHSCFIDILGNFMFKELNIICDETNMNKETRRPMLHMAHGYNYETIAVVIPNQSKKEVEKRIARREGCIEWASTSKDIWMQVWERKNNKFEMPTKEEGFDEILEVSNE